MLGFRKQGSTQAQTLSDITRGMQHAVNATQELLEQHYFRMLRRYFDDDNQPLMTRFKLSDDKIVEAPLIALISPKGLYLDEMSVEMTVRIDDSDVKRLEKTGTENESDRASFTVSFAPPKERGFGKRSNDITVKMKFKSGEPPEGVSRIIDQFTSHVLTKTIVPVTPENQNQTNTENT